jgi:hypothetical protein
MAPSDFDADPDHTFHFNTDPYPALHFDADPDTAFPFDTDSDPASKKLCGSGSSFPLRCGAGSSFKNDADPCGSGSETLAQSTHRAILGPLGGAGDAMLSDLLLARLLELEAEPPVLCATPPIIINSATR